MNIFQIIAILFALFMMYSVTLYGKKKLLSGVETSFWVATWSFFIVIAVFPDLLIGISRSLNFARVFDLLIVGALMVLTFFNYIRHKKLESKLEQLVRDTAIETQGANAKKSA